MTKTLVDEYVKDIQHMRLYQQERAIYDITTLIEDVMDDEPKVTRAELADRLGRTKGWVTQLLDGENNKTIRTVADVLAVLGRELRAFAPPIRISNEPGYEARLSSGCVGWDSAYPEIRLYQRNAG